VIGFTEEFFQKTRSPGSSKKSFGLRSDGKLIKEPSQIPDFSPKFEQSDTIGAGICYVSRKVFFTRNGHFLGKPFDIPEIYPLFASISINSPNDSVTLNFERNFLFDLKGLVYEENMKVESEVDAEVVDPREMFKLVRDYLEQEGYADTLIALEKVMRSESTEKIAAKVRSYSGRVSERYDSIDIDPECEYCENFGKLCKFCVKKVMENVEPANAIRLPESRNRCDSVEVSSIYLKPLEQHPADLHSPGYVNDVKARSLLRKMIVRGELNQALVFLTENFPEMLTDELCMLYFHVQEFIELIKAKQPLQALYQAREKLAKFVGFNVFYRNSEDVQIPVRQVVGLIAYLDPWTSPLKGLLQQAQMELTADLINSRITQKLREGKNSLEDMAKHLLALQSLYQDSVLMNKVERVEMKFENFN
jgi:hypothetical protein